MSLLPSNIPGWFPQFVNFTKIMSEHTDTAKKESAFALAALMEIPLQYRATLTLQYKDRTFSKLGPAESGPSAEQACPICLTNPKDMAFGCGHLTCKDCGVSISSCPLCRQPITTRLRLYG
ncbi:E3 ubiquitin-protein ligase RGLG3 [Sesamum angolense]|uniref:E3 ubiquitin-protein ligase RGLG3 n=1 Tax=Sesamum angolense TaxID=2727404 RepID=A0AAE1WIC0_9LAMI|nr:E3 ubiquitin-protein ligase RGLG3 [Sesamum angolense]